MQFANIFGGQDLLVIFVVVLLLFGGKKIPELMRGLGKGYAELQKGIEESKRVLEHSMHDQPEDEHKVHEIKPQPAENTLPHETLSHHSDPS